MSYLDSLVSLSFWGLKFTLIQCIVKEIRVSVKLKNYKHTLLLTIYGTFITLYLLVGFYMFLSICLDKKWLYRFYNTSTLFVTEINMRIPFFSMFMASPFDDLQEHAEKVKECAQIFQQAMECHVSNKCKTFEEFRREVAKLESEADAIKQNVRDRLPKRAMLPVDKFELFRYLGEQDQVIDAMEDALNWISYKSEPGIPKELEKDILHLVDVVIDPVEDLNKMVSEVRKYFGRYSEKQRGVVKDIIRNLSQKEHEADEVEDMIKEKVLNMKTDPVTVFHLFKLTETIGSIADHAENAGDMMEAMVAR